MLSDIRNAWSTETRNTRWIHYYFLLVGHFSRGSWATKVFEPQTPPMSINLSRYSKHTDNLKYFHLSERSVMKVKLLMKSGMAECMLTTGYISTGLSGDRSRSDSEKYMTCWYLVRIPAWPIFAMYVCFPRFWEGRWYVIDYIVCY